LGMGNVVSGEGYDETYSFEWESDQGLYGESN
jgi:hypothetical protein